MNIRAWVDGSPERPLLVLLLSYAVAASGGVSIFVIMVALIAGLSHTVVRGTATIRRDPRLEGREILLVVLVALAVASIALMVIGRWISFFFMLVVLMSESRRVPFPAGSMPESMHTAIAMLSTGFLVPVAGAALAGGFEPGSFAVLWATLPFALCELLPLPPEEDVEPIALKPSLIRSLAALVGLTACAAALATGIPLGLTPEFGLLGASVGIVLLAFAWLALFDPNITLRLRRVIAFARISAAALLLGALIMVLVL